MGCGYSKSESSSVVGETAEIGDQTEERGAATGLNIKGSDYNGRLVRSEGAVAYTFPKSKYSIQFAYVSQRGYYPDDPDKLNQDAFFCQTGFAGDPEQALFGVFDGHGEYGTECSGYCRDKVRADLVVLWRSRAQSAPPWRALQSAP